MQVAYGTPTEAAAHFKVCRKTVYNWIHAGILEAVRIGPHTLRVNLSQFEQGRVNA